MFCSLLSRPRRNTRGKIGDHSRVAPLKADVSISVVTRIQKPNAKSTADRNMVDLI